MGEQSAIAWTHATFNPWEGCQRVSPGCEQCYAETRNARFHPDGKGKASHWGPTAQRLMRSPAYWNQPAKWNRAAKSAGERRRVFVASLADVFEDRPELAAPRQRLFHLIEECDGLDWMLLTKRPENMVRLAKPHWPAEWPAHVWAGCTVEDDKRAEERVPHLLKVPAAVRFLSCEPLLEGVDLRGIPANFDGAQGDYLDALSGCEYGGQDEPHGTKEPSHVVARHPRIDLVIVGGESGPKARLYRMSWASEIREHCRDAGVAFFHKQLGSNAEASSGAPFPTKHRAGEDPAEWPAHHRIRMMPGDVWPS